MALRQLSATARLGLRNSNRELRTERWKRSDEMRWTSQVGLGIRRKLSNDQHGYYSSNLHLRLSRLQMFHLYFFHILLDSTVVWVVVE